MRLWQFVNWFHNRKKIYRNNLNNFLERALFRSIAESPGTPELSDATGNKGSSHQKDDSASIL